MRSERFADSAMIRSSSAISIARFWSILSTSRVRAGGNALGLERELDADALTLDRVASLQFGRLDQFRALRCPAPWSPVRSKCGQGRSSFPGRSEPPRWLRAKQCRLPRPHGCARFRARGPAPPARCGWLRWLRARRCRRLRAPGCGRSPACGCSARRRCGSRRGRVRARCARPPPPAARRSRLPGSRGPARSRANGFARRRRSVRR